MKKLMAVTLMAITLAGCAGSQPAEPPMPVDTNPSEGLRFARAMNLRTITDAGSNYLIYNTMSANGLVYPLTAPVTKGQLGDVQTTGHGSADVVAGAVTNTAFIPALSVLTSQRARPVFDGMPYIGSWAGEDVSRENAEIKALVKNTLAEMKGYRESEICRSGQTDVGLLEMRPGADGRAVAIDGTKLPRPPLDAKGNLKLYNFSNCFFGLATLEENQAVLRAMSGKLGKHRALFIPGSHEHPPIVYSNGTAYSFR